MQIYSAISYMQYHIGNFILICLDLAAMKEQDVWKGS